MNGFSKYYNDARNAVVVRGISECSEYLRRHFAMGSGDIWIYHTDLYAFWDCDSFASLYLKVIDRELGDKIRLIRLVIDDRELRTPEDKAQEAVKKDSGNYEKLLEKYRREDANNWEQIRNHLDQLSSTKHKIQFTTNAVIERKGSFPDSFKRFTSDESFIFYTRDGCKLGREAVCVQRLYVTPEHAHSSVEVSSLRIMIVAGDSPLHIFLDPRIRENFERIFSGGGWLAFWDEAEKRASLGKVHRECTVPSSHAVDSGPPRAQTIERTGKAKDVKREGGIHITNSQIIGSVGRNSHAEVVAVQQPGSQKNEEIDFEDLVSDLANLRRAMRDRSSGEGEHDEALGQIAQAEKAAKGGDRPAVFRHLKNAGKWALEVATDIGVRVAAETINRSMRSP